MNNYRRILADVERIIGPQATAPFRAYMDLLDVGLSPEKAWSTAQAAQDRPGRHETPSARGRDGSDAPDAATGHQRVERCECGHTKHDHRWGWNARLYGTCPISGCPCDDYATQEEPRP